MPNITQAFILAAGRGDRMRPLTDTIPKPLAKINGKAMIDYIIEKLSNIPSIKQIIVNSHYLADILEAHLKSLNNPKIIISHENEKLETGGGLINAINLININQPLLIINGDFFWQDEQNSLLNTMIENFNAEKMDILLALKPKEQFFGYEGNGDFNLNTKNNAKIGEVSTAASPTHAYVGVQIIHPKILAHKPQEKCFSLSHFFKRSQDKNGILQNVQGLEIKEKCFHIGTVKHLYQINSNTDF